MMKSNESEATREKSVPIDALTKIVEVLGPLSSEDRARAINAAMVLLGDSPSKIASVERGVIQVNESGGELAGLPPRARTWMKQHDVSETELQQVFNVTPDGVEVIVHMPGKSKKEQTYNAYVLTGLGQLLATGTPFFQDKSARALCESSGCYDSANHAAHLKDKGNEFTGTKEKGWTLTAPGLKRAAEIVKELNKAAP